MENVEASVLVNLSLLHPREIYQVCLYIAQGWAPEQAVPRAMGSVGAGVSTAWPDHDRVLLVLEVPCRSEPAERSVILGQGQWHCLDIRPPSGLSPEMN